MDDETYKAKSNGLMPEDNAQTQNDSSPEDNKQIEQNEDARNIENNANNLRNAANVAMKTKIPHAVAAGAIVKGADKLTGGKSSQIVGKALNDINKRIPLGNKIQEASNRINESGVSDAVGAATSLDKTEQAQKAVSAAEKATNNNNGSNNAKGSGTTSIFPKKKLKNKFLIIGIASACLFFFFVISLLFLF